MGKRDREYICNPSLEDLISTEIKENDAEIEKLEEKIKSIGADYAKLISGLETEFGLTEEQVRQVVIRVGKWLHDEEKLA